MKRRFPTLQKIYRELSLLFSLYFLQDIHSDGWLLSRKELPDFWPDLVRVPKFTNQMRYYEDSSKHQSDYFFQATKRRYYIY